MQVNKLFLCKVGDVVEADIWDIAQIFPFKPEVGASIGVNLSIRLTVTAYDPVRQMYTVKCESYS